MSIYAISPKSSYDGEYFTQNLRETQNTHSVFNQFLPRKSRCLRKKVEKYNTVRQATDDNIIGLMRFACCIIETHTQNM